MGLVPVPLHSASQYQSISTTISAKRRYFVLRSCCGTPQEHPSSTLWVVSQSILYVWWWKLQFRNPLLLLYWLHIVLASKSDLLSIVSTWYGVVLSNSKSPQPIKAQFRGAYNKNSGSNHNINNHYHHHHNPSWELLRLRLRRLILALLVLLSYYYYYHIILLFVVSNNITLFVVSSSSLSYDASISWIVRSINKLDG